MDLLNVGDEVSNLCDPEPVTVTSIERGKHGLLWRGKWNSSIVWSYLPYELPPVSEPESDWYGWHHRCTDTLPNGIKVGSLAGSRMEPDTLEHHESKWNESIEMIKAEQ